MTDTISVEQLDKPGDINHGKWFVVRGAGKNAEYLKRDITWHKDNPTSEAFFWLTQGAAEVAVTRVRAAQGLC